MKSTWWIVVLAALAMPVMSGAIFGDEVREDAAAAESARQIEKVVEEAKRMAQAQIESIDPVVKLTEAQKAEIIDACIEVMKRPAEHYAKNREKYDALTAEIQKAQKLGDEFAVERASEKYRKLGQPVTESYKRYQERQAKWLTPEQKAKLEEFHLLRAIKENAKPAELSEQQLKTVMATLKMAEGPKYAVLPQAVQDVLTHKQKMHVAKTRALESMKVVFGRVTLSPEQLTKMQGFADQVVLDTTLQQQEINQQLMEKVSAILTAEQRAAMTKGQGR